MGTYQASSLPIGAVVTDTHVNVLARRRNRIHERSGEWALVLCTKDGLGTLPGAFCMF